MILFEVLNETPITFTEIHRLLFENILLRVHARPSIDQQY
jgi:hypothetical protein